MPADDIDIANSALSLCEAPPIASLDDDQPRAEAVKALMPLARRFVLAGSPWKVALGRKSLPANAQAPAWGWARAFDWPGDCLRPHFLNGEEEGEAWTSEGRQILTNAAAPAELLYVRDVVELSMTEPLLAMAIAHYLAYLAAPRVQGEASAQQSLLERYTAHLRMARSASAIIGTPRRIEADEFVMARHGAVDGFGHRPRGVG